MNSNIGAYKSPSKTHSFNFILAGEIRFGPTYYQLELDGSLIPDRIFGFEFKWDAESKFLALQEWLTTDYQKGPITALTIINLELRQLARISLVDKGFAIPLRFETGRIIFEKDFLGTGKKIEFEVSLAEIKNWEFID